MKYTKSESKSWARETMRGHWTTMVSPFTPDGELDEAGLRSNIRYVLSLGTEGLGFTWSYGEFWALTLNERKRIAEIAVEEVRGKALVGIHTSHACLKDCLELTRHAEGAGADMAILMAPPLARTDDQAHDFFKYVAGRVSIGIGIYNNPVVSGMMISPQGIGKIADIQNVIVTKEAYPFFPQIVNVFRIAGEKIVVSCPHDEIYPYLELFGIRQQFLFASESDWMVDRPGNMPRREFLNLALKGDIKGATEVYRTRVGPIIGIRHKWFKHFRDQGTFPVHLGKYWGELVGMAGGPVRLPSVPLTEELKQSIKNDLQKVGFLKR